MMIRRLHEAKSDLELAVLKSLDRAPLTSIELQELSSMSVRDLMVDYDLDHVLAEKVASHVKYELLRLQAQNQQTPIDGFDSNFTSLTRSNPISQRSGNLTEVRLRRVLRQLIREELSG